MRRPSMQNGDFGSVSELKPQGSRLPHTIRPVFNTSAKSICGILLLLLVTQTSLAQIKCGAGSSAPSTGLACLVQVAQTPMGLSPAAPSQPKAAGLVPDSLNFLSSEIGAEVSQIPLASPASGIIYTNNPVTQLPEQIDQSFGPILTQRAQTIGRHRIYLATTYQYFLLQDIDGLALKNLPSVIYLNSPNNSIFGPPDVAGISNNYLQLKVHQFVGYFTYGLTKRIDVSVAVPLLRVDLRDTFAESFAVNSTSSFTQPAPTSGTHAGEATGVGDIVLATKINVWKLRRADRDHGGFSVGVEARMPSGDSRNYLGSGAFGAKPFATFSYAGRYSPHFNVGFQVNGKTELITLQGPSTGKGTLPNRLIYSGGIDFKLLKQLTVNVDGIAQRVFNAPRASLLGPPIQVFQNFTLSPQQFVTNPYTASYTRADAAGGIKLNPFKGFLISGNVSVKLNQAGLRSRVVPLVGGSYTF